MKLITKLLAEDHNLKNNLIEIFSFTSIKLLDETIENAISEGYGIKGTVKEIISKCSNINIEYDIIRIDRDKQLLVLAYQLI